MTFKHFTQNKPTPTPSLILDDDKLSAIGSAFLNTQSRYAVIKDLNSNYKEAIHLKGLDIELLINPKSLIIKDEVKSITITKEDICNSKYEIIVFNDFQNYTNYISKESFFASFYFK